MSKVEIQVGKGVEKDSHNHSLEWNQKVEEIVIGQEQSKDPDHVQELVQIETGLGVISVESVVILQGNIPNSITDEDSDHDGLDQATLQMLTQDNLVDSDTHAPVECLNM